MPWTKSRYPAAMKNLSPFVRNKAIEVANALKEDGYNDAAIIPIAIEVAKNRTEGIG